MVTISSVLLVCISLFSTQILYHRMRQKSQCFQWFSPISPAQTVVNPVTGRWAFGCSICSPSMNQRYCCGVSTFTSDSERGHWYAPCSSRLYSRMKPSFSQYKPLIRSRRPQNRNSVLVNGSSSNCCWTRRARPSMPLRRSVQPQAMLDFICAGEVVQHRRRSSTSIFSCSTSQPG